MCKLGKQNRIKMIAKEQKEFICKQNDCIIITHPDIQIDNVYTML